MSGPGSRARYSRGLPAAVVAWVGIRTSSAPPVPGDFMALSKFVGGAVFVVIAAVAIQGVSSRFAPPLPIRAVSQSTSPVKGLDLRMDALVRKNVARRGEEIPVVLTLTNVSPRPLTALRFEWISNGFSLDRTLAFPGGLAGRSTAQLSFNVSSSEARGAFSPAMVAWWRDGDGIERMRALPLGPLRIESTWQTRTIWLAHVFQLTVKDLGLPLVLAFLGFWFKKKEDDRAKVDRDAAEERALKDRQAAESRALADRKAADDRATSDRVAAEDRASRQQVFSLLLPKSHD